MDEPRRPARSRAEAYQAMWRDLRTVVEDLAKTGISVGRIARMFGLQPAEVLKILKDARRSGG